MSEPKALRTSLGIPESPRWHEGRLWFCNWIDRQVVAVSLDGRAEVMATRDPDSHPMGYSIDWLPDGRLLVTGDKLRRQQASGSMVVHVDHRANEIAVDIRGNIYLNGADCSSAPPRGGWPTSTSPTSIGSPTGLAPARSSPFRSRYPAPAGHGRGHRGCQSAECGGEE